MVLVHAPYRTSVGMLNVLTYIHNPVKDMASGAEFLPHRGEPALDLGVVETVPTATHGAEQTGVGGS
ncbi:MAG: hypothetical protein CL483_09800 [Acidobacteria bacterium]|nr:hypothetical protein [Acidobacteriota bacterium]